MKRGKCIGLSALLAVLLALPALAAPEALVPVGRCVGIMLEVQGVTVVGFPEGESAARDAGLRPGDRIVAIDDTEVEDPAEIRALLHPGEQVVLRVLRSGKENTFAIRVPAAAELGILARDGISGIGTVTFYDPETGLFGALGHGISETGSGSDRELTPVAAGRIVPASVVEVVPGQSGQPGTLRGSYEETVLGEIERNTEAGIFGHGTLMTSLMELGQTLPLGEAALGPATILANVEGDKVAEYSVEILDLDPTAPTRNLLVQVTDPQLLAATGGIVQGMSGSPILQNGRLVGAVTHVLLNDPAKGYGILIENMWRAAEKGE